jgi:D-tyrosyl-tRNA(Tyr) deacylase
MKSLKKAVFFFCVEAIEHVAGNVLNASREIFELTETDIEVDGNRVTRYTDREGSSFYYVPTRRVVSHDYKHYLPVMNEHFSVFDLAGIITWHEGENAPDRVLTVHTTGDVDSGSFGPADPGYMRNLLLALERKRAEAGMNDFRVTTEATHWSGMVYGGGSPQMIPEFNVPLLDIEIGSAPESWADGKAVRVLAESLPCVFESDGRRVRNLLCAGGVHFEPSFAAAAFQEWDNCAFGVSHILANQWLVSGHYEDESGPERLEACVKSIAGGIDGIAFHDNLKGVYKDRFRRLGEKYGIPVVKHQALRRPETIAWKE